MNLVITGTSSGIGQAIARHLIATGHEICGLARRPQPAGEHFRTAICDVGDSSAVARTAQQIAEQWSHIDGLVCCAGSVGAIGPAMNIAPDQWSATVHANLDGTFHTIHAFFELLQRSPRRGKIVCFSGGGATSPRANFSAYGVAKTGIVRLVETLAVEWGGQAVDINAIAPGAIKTAMTEQIARAGAAAGAAEVASAQRQLETGGQLVDNVLGLVAFLLSPESDGVSGKLIAAQWDDWGNFVTRRDALMKSDIYTLRRLTEDTAS